MAVRGQSGAARGAWWSHTSSVPVEDLGPEVSARQQSCSTAMVASTTD